MRDRILLALLLLAPAGAKPAWAEKRDLDELLLGDLPVISATLTKKSVLSAPADVTVVSKEEIRASGAKSLAEILERVNGVAVFENEFGSKRLALRGLSSGIGIDKIKLMFDGHSIEEPIWGDYDEYLRTGLGNVERIEIVRGPGSALYGAGAFAGIINVITRKPKGARGGGVDASYGSFNSSRADLNYNGGRGDADFFASFSGYNSDGPKLTLKSDGLSNTSMSLAPGTPDQSENNIKGDVGFSYKNFALTGSYLKSKINRLLAQFPYLTQDGEHEDAYYAYLEAQYDLPIADGLTLRNKASYDWTQLKDKGQETPRGFDLGVLQGFPAGRDLNGDGIPENWPNGVQAEFGYSSNLSRVESRLDYQILDNNKLLLGVFYDDLHVYNTFVRSDEDPVTLMNAGSFKDFSAAQNWMPETLRTVKGVFFQDEWDILRDWYFIAGGRYDRYNDVGESFNPRVGLVWDYDRQGGTVKLLYGSAFKAPTFSELLETNNPILVGNPNLKPEKIESGELVVSNVLADKYHTDAAFYIYQTQDFIQKSQDKLPNGAAYWKNYGYQTGYGAELNEKYVFARRNYAYAGYSYIQTRDDTAGGDIPLVPRHHQALAGLNLHFLDRVNWDLHLNYTGEILREVGDSRDRIPWKIVTDTSLRYEDFHGFDFYFTVRNLADEDVSDPSPAALAPLSDIPQPRRSFVGGASWRF